MKCGCQECGALMDHVEKGDQSYCVCPLCLYKCTDCLGGDNPRFGFLDKDTVKSMKENTQMFLDIDKDKK